MARRDPDELESGVLLERACELERRDRRSARDPVPALLEGERDPHRLDSRSCVTGRFSLESTAPRADNGDRRSGWLLARRVAARRGLRGLRRRPARARGIRRPACGHRRPPDGRAGRSPRPELARRRAPVRASLRGLQPCRAVVRPALVGRAGADGRVRRRRRHRDARGDPRGRPGDPLLPGVVERDLRRAGRDASERVDAARAADAVRRRQGLRAFHLEQLSPPLRALRLLRDPLQPRVAAAAARLPAPQGGALRRGDLARARAASSCSATSTPAATGGMRATTSGRCGSCCSRTSRPTTSSRPARATRCRTSSSARSPTSGSTGGSTSGATRRSGEAPRSCTISSGIRRRARERLGWRAERRLRRSRRAPRRRRARAARRSGERA